MKRRTIIIINMGLILLLGICVAVTYQSRGYLAFGGEWLLPIMVNMGILIYDLAKDEFKEDKK